MTETNKAFQIIKTRWPEVMLIIGLRVLLLFVNKLLTSQVEMDPGKALINVLFFLVLGVVMILLTLGFQRTVCLEGLQPQRPVDLLREGKRFFWRSAGFGLLYAPVFFTLAWLIFSVINPFVPGDAGFFQTATTTPWVYQLCVTATTFILIKPLLLMVPLIIVLDCRITESFKFLKQCKLSNARELVIVFAIAIAVGALWLFMPPDGYGSSFSQYVLLVLLSVIQQFVELIIMIMAVRFVASCNLVYDSGSGTLLNESAEANFEE